jgi:hypothetical protein
MHYDIELLYLFPLLDLHRGAQIAAQFSDAVEPRCSVLSFAAFALKAHLIRNKQ